MGFLARPLILLFGVLPAMAATENPRYSQLQHHLSLSINESSLTPVAT